MVLNLLDSQDGQDKGMARSPEEGPSSRDRREGETVLPASLPPGWKAVERPGCASGGGMGNSRSSWRKGLHGQELFDPGRPYLYPA